MACAAVTALLAKGADVNATCVAGTPLSFAAAHTRTDVVSDLLDAGADPMQLLDASLLDLAPSVWARLAPLIPAEQKPGFLQLRSGIGNTLLICAVQRSEVAALCILNDWQATRDDITAANSIGRTALYFAAQQGFSNIAALLLDKGAEANAPADASPQAFPLYAALMFCVESRRVESVQTLLRGGAHLGPSGNLLEAVLEHVPDVSSFFMHGGQLHDFIATPDAAGNTALHVAVRLRRFGACQQLVALGADPLQPNSLNQLPLHIAEPGSALWLFLAGLHADAVLLWADANGDTPLHIAARSGDPALLRELIVRCDKRVHTLLNGEDVAGMPQLRHDCPLKVLIGAIVAQPRPERVRPLPSLTGPVPLALKAGAAHFEGLYARRDDGDVTLRVAGGARTAHSLVLKACSFVIRMQLRDTPGADITLDGSVPCPVTVETVDALLRYIYTGELADTSDEVVHALLFLAGYYRISHLPQLLEQRLLAHLSADTATDLLQLAITPGVPQLPALLRAAQHCAAQCVYRGLDSAPAIAVLMQDMLRSASDAAARGVATGFFDALLAVQAENCDAEADARYCDDLAAQAAEFVRDAAAIGEDLEDYDASRTFMDGVRLEYVTNVEIGDRHVIRNRDRSYARAQAAPGDRDPAPHL